MHSQENGFVLPDLPEPIVLGATHFNAGVFGGGHHDELDQHQEPVLNSAESFVRQAVTAYLRRHDRVVFLDLGAMCGLSATILAAEFSKEIARATLVMVATQLEQQYTIENILAEAKKRLTLQAQRAQLGHINRTTLTRDNERALDNARARTQLFLTSGELAFMKTYHHLVHFITGVDTAHLPDALNKKLGIGKIHVLHEYSAGLTFADNKRVAAIAVADAMAPDGMILSPVGWQNHNDNSAYLQWDSRGLSAKNISLPDLPKRPSYALFTFPDAPRVT